MTAKKLIAKYTNQLNELDEQIKMATKLKNEARRAKEDDKFDYQLNEIQKFNVARQKVVQFIKDLEDIL